MEIGYDEKIDCGKYRLSIILGKITCVSSISFAYITHLLELLLPIVQTNILIMFNRIEYATNTKYPTQILSSNLLEGNDHNKHANELLLPTLQKQSRYWIPLLLGWLRQDDERIDNIDLPSSLDRHLPLTSKRIRQLQKKDGGSGGEVTVEILKALALWTEWGVRPDKPTTLSPDNGDDATTTYHVSNPHKPMHPSCQKRLMQQPDAMPMLVSLLSSPLLTATHEHLIWIVGSLSSSGINCPSSTENNNSSSSSPSRSKNNSAATAAAAEVTKAMKSGTSGSNANANSVDASVSMPAASAAADLDDDSNHKEKSSSSASARDAILAAGAMPPLLKILESDPHNLPLQRIGAWCLSSMDARFIVIFAATHCDT